ncbi:hypothetical protein FIV34_12930 [Luteibacter pinisoli]|uniref:Uncharacterized protein n=1 Tax=Luteibacter pinisoli TaxID=2589080 RepID=A0A4Y5Z6U7_9GAMM|nr:hypothetical protein [Luteibacter pinisoli]QDE40055.1 hypothetical protein FIV34_12930 [Luteibacter pinisoli]
MATVEQYYQEMGGAARALAQNASGRIALLAHAEDGFITVTLFYIERGNPQIRCVFPPEPVVKNVYDFWEEWGRSEGDKPWMMMCLIIDNDDFTIDFLYPDEFEDGFPGPDDEARLLTRYFGSDDVDRSNPDVEI